MPTTPQDRLVEALRPSPANHDRVTRQVDKLTLDAGAGAVAAIAEAAEHPAGIGATETAQLAGVSYRQLDHWVRLGYLTPGHRHGSSSTGQLRVFVPGDVQKARLMGSLVRLFEMNPSSAARVADQILDHGSAEVDGFRLTAKGLAS